jgi:HSP20 family protein
MLRNRDQGKFKPPSDVIATEDKFIIRVEIAGMNIEDFKLSLINRQLVISGNRTLAHIDHRASYQQVEIETGEFRLSYALQQPVLENQVTANYQNGLLQVELPYMPKKTVKVVMANTDKKDN